MRALMFLATSFSFRIICVLLLETAQANPKSKPYVPFRTNPLDQPGVLDHTIEIPPDRRRSKPRRFNQKAETEEAKKCPLQFSLGISRRAHQPSSSALGNQLAITSPPNIYPVHPSYGPGRQVIHTTQYELLDLLSPIQLWDKSSIIKEGIQQHADFPLLLESSSFHVSPLIHDANGDGIPDAILVDYDGGLYRIGLQVGKDLKRYFARAQLSRLYVRKTWVEARLNQTLAAQKAQEGENNSTVTNDNRDPFHTYFEYNTKANDEGKLQAKPANILNQANEDLKALEDRRQRRVNHTKTAAPTPNVTDQETEVPAEDHRRLDEVVPDETQQEQHDDAAYEDVMGGEGTGWGDDDAPVDDDYEREDGDDVPRYEGDDYYGGGRYYGDDYYGRDYDNYYEDKNYIRLPPHVMSDPVLVELPKAYSNDKNEKEEMLFLAVSYFLDEDEYQGFFSYKRFDNTDSGDEDETKRGMHVASAILVYIMDGGTARFGREEHLDLSGDWTAPQNSSLVAEVPVLLEDGNKMGAFALASPTVADIDGNGEDDVLLGTSMGIIYGLSARHLYKIDGWPVQVPHPIESRVLVEDTMGDTNLEVYVSDVAGNVYCFTHKGELRWRRDLVQSIMSGPADVRGMSEMTLGDINGDGVLDLVVVLKMVSKQGAWSTYVVALNVQTGDDVRNFPTVFESPLLVDDGAASEDLVQSLPQPLLVDLHGDQSHWSDYLRRNGTAWKPPPRDSASSEAGSSPQGGSAWGLHIVQPVGSKVHIIEAGSGCVQSVSIGEEVAAMVQADDVHGTNNIDLLVSTVSGNLVTLDSPGVPYHPLNVWNTGKVRGRRNNFAQGFTASQGIFVHDVSRRYRDVFGVYVPVTFEIFDNRPNIERENDKRRYKVEIRDGTSIKRAVFRREYTETGVYTERLYISYGPGFYTLTIVLKTTHSLYYEDVFHIGYNVHFMDGFSTLLWLPLVLATIPILLCAKKKATWDDDDFGEDDDARGGRGLGILGRATTSL